jgi:hypothetical protein
MPNNGEFSGPIITRSIENMLELADIKSVVSYYVTIEWWTELLLSGWTVRSMSTLNKKSW